MDISDLVRLVENLFPVLIFLIWILLTVVASSRKKGPLGKPTPPAERPTYGEPRAPQNSDESDSSQISDDLRRTLETIFGEHRHTEEEPSYSEQYEQYGQYERYEEPESQPEPSYKTNETVEMQTSRESAVLEEQAEIQRRFEELQKIPDQSSSVAPPMQAIEEDEYDNSEITLSHDELRKGIIWAEIIGPPVSMRS